MGVDFLDFLRSGDRDIHAFAETRHRQGRRFGSGHTAAVKSTAANVPEATSADNGGWKRETGLVGMCTAISCTEEYPTHLQGRPTGGAQRSGAKSGAKRFDLSSDHGVPAWIQPVPSAFILKDPCPSPQTVAWEIGFELEVL
jgi:hypothetical protein